MAQVSAIEWTESTWNIVTGCTKTSPGCKNCYAERMAFRLKAMGQPRYKNGFSLTLHPDLLEEPLRWNKSKFVFVNSMSDLFHAKVPLWFIRKAFDVMRDAHWHTFQILTKRAERLEHLCGELSWPSNVWIGVTVENQDCVNKIKHLRKVPTAVRFLSLEPLLGPVQNLPLDGINWVIVGGESGPQARPIESEWVRSIRNQCICKGVAFFFKQWGGHHRSRNGRTLDGRIWNEMPLLSRSNPPLKSTS
jgi:protein gp37